MNRAVRAEPRLLADIGGTNTRFAWQCDRGANIAAVETLACAEHATLADALRSYLHRLGLLVINDFTALALALPTLVADERCQVGGTAQLPEGAIALIGPGTGLGVSGLLPDGRGGWVLQGEGGHATQASTTAREHAVRAELARRHGHVTAERAVCGQGLQDIHCALSALERANELPRAVTAAEIAAAALDGRDDNCTEALSLFRAFLGIAAGDLALTLAAHGGVYIGGGIVPRLGETFDRSPFRSRFEAKGRFAVLLAMIPVYVIDAKQPPALRGAACALDTDAPFAGRAA